MSQSSASFGWFLPVTVSSNEAQHTLIQKPFPRPRIFLDTEL